MASDSDTRPKSRTLTPGTKLRYKPDGTEVTLARRKQRQDYRSDRDYLPGWWLTGDDGGLADLVIDAENSSWEVVE